MSPAELLDMARELSARGVAYALVTVVRAVAPTSAYVGAQAVVLADGTLHGWIGGGCAKGAVVEVAQRAIETGAPKLVRISNDEIRPDDDVEQRTMSCASNGTIELFIQPYAARALLCVLGATPAADEARFLAERLGIGLADAPEGVSVVLVATQGQGDEDALERALRSGASQVLMIASRRKTSRLRDTMRMRGLREPELERLIAPAGPDAGAKTPREVALVSMVGVLAFLRGQPAALADRGESGAATSAATVLSDSTPTPIAPEPGESHAATADKFVNPVCGIAVDKAGARHVESYDGEQYYFCCDCCWESFRNEPEKYAAIYRAAQERASA